MPVLRRSTATVQYFTPSYSLYPVLADIHGAARNAVPLKSDFGLPGLAELKHGRIWNFRAALTFVTTPNAPSGRGYPTRELDALCKAQRGVVVLDEAYVDFAGENALKLALKHPHVLVARTFSKAYSLCFQRVGYFVGHRDLIAALHKIRDSYNVNGLGQIGRRSHAGRFAVLPGEFQKNHRHARMVEPRIDETRFPGVAEPDEFHSRPAAAIFVARIGCRSCAIQKVLVRWFDRPEVRDYLRITIGTAAEAKALVRAVRKILPRR